jgi:hypothetical protein
MKLKHAYFPAVMSALAGVLLIPALNADPLLKRTEVTFNDPVEIPGMVLMPGTYVMKLLDPLTGESTNKDIVRFYDKNEKHLYAMVFAVPAYREHPVDRTVITFEERAGGAPRAINKWFYPDDNWGEQFVYSKVHPLAVAEAAPAPLAPTPAPAATPQPSAQPRRVAQNQLKPQPQQIAQAQPAPVRTQPVAPAAAAPAPAQPAQPKRELPKTASDLPLAALAGVFFLLAGACLRRKAA